MISRDIAPWNERSSAFGVTTIVSGMPQEPTWWSFGMAAERSIEIGRISFAKSKKQVMTSEGKFSI